MRTITLDEIRRVLPRLDLLPAIERGFVAYSQGRAVVPPVGELLLDRGDVHIKYGYIRDEKYYVIKIASGFHRNADMGLPTGDGLMLLFWQETGRLEAVLLDEGFLTDTRTAVAGAIAARHLAPRVVERIGIAGTGAQARLQLRHLGPVLDCRDVLVWGRGRKQLGDYRDEMTTEGWNVETTTDTADLTARCEVIVTTTPATAPLLDAKGLRPGTHITAVGSDTPVKQELDAAVLGRADVVVADSVEQCRERGEIHMALEAGTIVENDVIELGDVISGRVDGRTSDNQITVADLTGVAVQDMKIAEAVYEAVVND